ncbi:cellulose binding domain-containing protein [Micromonospora sp. WMMD1120]|uniref:cellulose binding domain-containing protein n=1 Tax=Micromonospora sp. WMMD1120 TaxID=3016106 RepID=UPI0024178079|nr:cellulose binding domain-containing protein [Micromonospora sp. WMMD1120]MDG4808089.1 cellulose binding domain-containing protein [Micromonospora sp. WMMD1120]
MRTRRVTATIALAALASALAVGAVTAAQADGPAISTPGSPTVVANEPRQLTLRWAPSAWIDDPTNEQPINYEVQVPLGPNTYRFLGSTTDTTITLTDLVPGTTYRIAIAARALGGYSDASAATTVRTVNGRATVSYLNLDWSPTNNQIHYLLRITNTGAAPLDLSTVRVRYYLRFEGGNTSLVPNCDWAAVGCSRIQQTVQFFPPPGGPGGPSVLTTPAPPNPPPGTAVPGWVELTFTDGTLAPGQSTGPIQLRHHRHSWSTIDERDDPSWLAATGQWTENGRITLDVDEVREFGDTNT